MKTDSGYVLKNSDELYFIGLNQADIQLRKAKIYHSEKWARDSAEDINSNNHRLSGVRHDFDLVKVEITEVESGEKGMTIELSKCAIDAIAYAVAKKMKEPKTGHWITKPHHYGVAFCSECGYVLRVNDTNYCPNCGAKMESEDKE